MDKIYSGKLVIRISAETHKALAEKAKKKDLSLNRLIKGVLHNFAQIPEKKDTKYLV